MKNLALLFTFLLFATISKAQIGINATGTAPSTSAMLDVSSTTKGVLLPRMTTTQRTALTATQGLTVYDTNTNSYWYHNGTSWINMATGGGGSASDWVTNGSNTYLSNLSGNVGIGTQTPSSKLDIEYFGGESGLRVRSTNSSASINIETTNDLGSASLTFSNNNVNKWALRNFQDDFQIGETGGGTRIHIENNTGNIGIGTNSPVNILDVNGRARLRYNGVSSGIWMSPSTNATTNLDGAFYGLANDNTAGIYIGGAWRMELTNTGNMALDGSLTVKNGKGVAYDPSSATNLRIYPFTTASFGAVIPGFGMSAETAIIFGGNFTTAPKVIVGDIDYTLGSVGELYRVQLVLYGCKIDDATYSSCKARLINTSPNPVNYNIVWNCVAIGN